SEPLKIQYKPVTRVENMCATGSESLRQACYAVASGAYDIAMAIGVEKLKDSGFSGLVMTNPPNDGTPATITPPALFSLLAPAYFKKYGLDPEKGRDVLARIAWKNHKNGAKNPKAQFQKEVSLETIKNSPKIADPLGIMDCSGVSDGSAAAIVVRAEDAHKYCKNPIYMKALSFIAGPAEGPLSQDYDFTTFRERGTAWQDVMDGYFDLDGKLPVNPDGGLKSFGHPIGASGLRMMYEMWLQLRGEAGPRQIKNPKVGLTHNLGGAPGRCVSFVSVVGREVG